MIDYFYPPQPKRLWPDSPYLSKLCKNPLWDAEIKYNGWRLLIFVDNIIKLYNRHGTIIDINAKVFHGFFKKIPSDTIFDAELINFRTKDIKNTIVIFDTVYYHGQDLKRKPLSERRKYLDHFMTAPSSLYSEQPQVFKIQQFSTNFIDLYNTIINRNDPIEEGIVIKQKTSIYRSHVSRGIEINDWLKIRKIGDHAKV